MRASAVVRESGRVVWSGGRFVAAAARGVVSGRDDGTFLVFDVLSGVYSFAA